MLRPSCLSVYLGPLLLPALAACAAEQPPPTVQIADAPGPSAPRQGDGPAHHWHFDEPSGSVARDPAGGADGALGTGVVRVAGCSGNAAALAGSPQSVVDLGRKAGAFGTRDLTVSLWFRTTTTKRNNEILSNRANGSHGNFFNLRFGSSGVVLYELDEDSAGRNYVALTSRPGLNDGAWHHAAAWRLGPFTALFIDGVRVAAGKTEEPTRVDNGAPLEIGASSVAAEYDLYFDGAVDEVAIYRRALGESEIASLAAGPAGCRPGAR